MLEGAGFKIEAHDFIYVRINQISKNKTSQGYARLLVHSNDYDAVIRYLSNGSRMPFSC